MSFADIPLLTALTFDVFLSDDEPDDDEPRDDGTDDVRYAGWHGRRGRSSRGGRGAR